MECRKFEPEIVCENWCKKWDIGIIPEVEYRTLHNKRGHYNDEKNPPLIILGLPFKPEYFHPIAGIELLHELRHHYQKMKYPEVFEWWVSNSKAYDEFYWTFNCLELDANIFSWNRGKRDGHQLLDAFLILMKESESMVDLGKWQYICESIILENDLGFENIKRDIIQNLSAKQKDEWYGKSH